MPKILMPIGDASEVLDTFYPFYRLPEDGFEVVVAGKEARTYHLVQHQIPAGWEVTRETPGYDLDATVAFRDVQPAEYVGIFISGGRAPEYLRYDEDLLQITRHFFEASKPVAVVCHGIEIVVAADCIRGRTATTVPKCALDVIQGDATYVDESVVVDGNLVTARTWNDNTLFMKKFVEMLKASES
jgi:protease I